MQPLQLNQLFHYLGCPYVQEPNKVLLIIHQEAGYAKQIECSDLTGVWEHSKQRGNGNSKITKYHRERGTHMVTVAQKSRALQTSKEHGTASYEKLSK